MNMVKMLIGVVATVATLNAANAADIMMVNSHTIGVNGMILPGDHAKIVDLASENNVDQIMLTSVGGDVVEALEIGNFIRTNNITTVAMTYCNSACAYIWLAGSPTEVFKFSKNETLFIKIHMPAFGGDVSIPIPDWLHSDIEEYLIAMGVNELGVSEIMATPFTDAIDIGPKNAGRWGLTVAYAANSATND